MRRLTVIRHLSEAACRKASFTIRLATCCLLALLLLATSSTRAQVKDFPLGPGDVVRVSVFQSPDLTTETRISESGVITFPLLGEVRIAGLSTSAAEQRIAQRLKEGGFILQPQVNLTVVQFRSIQVSVLGLVNRPGRFPVEGAPYKVTDVLALAGGISQLGADVVTLITWRTGREQRIEIDIPAILSGGDLTKDLQVANGDIIHVPRAPMFYIYGEVQRPGQYRIEKNMTLLQALATGGGLTPRGTERGIKVQRRLAPGGQVEELKPSMSEAVMADDVVYVRESLF